MATSHNRSYAGVGGGVLSPARDGEVWEMTGVECWLRWPLPGTSIKYPIAGFGAAVMVVVSAARSIQKNNGGIMFGF